MEKQQGELYLVATPIGNLEDITLRAIKTLNQADIILAEDTRHTLKLLNHLQINKPLISYHRHNEQTKTDQIIKQLQQGKKIALVSDAGTPIISDPGEEIVKQALKNNIKITPIPGPCALITALIASGITAKEFTFMGFLPQNKKNRQEKLTYIQEQTTTTILYEAPHKLIETLNNLQNYISSRKIVIAKELTKLHETYYTGTVKQLLQKQEIQDPKGEYIIIIEGAEKTKTQIIKEQLNQLPLQEHYEYYQNQGLSKKDIIKQIAKDRKLSKNEIYKQFI